MKASIHTRRHFTSEVCEKKAIPTSTIERCYPMFIRQRECHYYYYRDVHYYVIICPDRCLLIGYDVRLSKRRIFRRSRIEAESQSNRNCNSCFKRLLQLRFDCLARRRYVEYELTALSFSCQWRLCVFLLVFLVLLPKFRGFFVYETCAYSLADSGVARFPATAELFVLSAAVLLFCRLVISVYTTTTEMQ